MTVTAPPRPPQPSDPARHDDAEALIEEARQRQRRRRRRYAAAAALLMLIGASVSLILARPGPSQSIDAEPSPPPAAAVNRDEAATLIAHHLEVHEAYVLIYDDGRVIVALDGPGIPTFERHLTPAGVELVRSGAIGARSVLQDILRTDLDRPRNSRGELVLLVSVSATPISSLPAGTWADSEFRRYEPSRYAVCAHDVGLDFALRITNRHLPAAAALLRGKERTYSDFDVLRNGEPIPYQCFELSTEETRALNALNDYGFPEPGDMSEQSFPVADGRVGFRVHPILPHGEPVGFPG